MYAVTLSTTPPMGLKVESNSSLGFGGLFITAFNTTTNVKFQGFCPLHSDISNPWTQLVEILRYCGVTKTPAEAEAWYKQQTGASYVEAIRKFLVEVFFPALKVFLNRFITPGQAPVSGTLVTTGAGAEFVLKTMQVSYNSDGTIKDITI